MSNLRTALLSLSLAACGGDPTPAHVGYWTHQLSDKCTAAMHLNDDSTYVGQILCATGANSVNIQVETGTYTFGDGSMTLVPLESTCAYRHDAFEADVLNAEATDVRLTLADADVVVSFERHESSGAGEAPSFSAVFGCFEAGTFTRSPLTAK